MKHVQPPPRMETVGGEPPTPDATGPLLWIDAEVMAGTGARIHVRSYCTIDDSVADQDRVADAMMRLALRQRAIQELPDLVKAMAEKERTIEARRKAESDMLERRPGTLAERLRAKEDAEAAVEKGSADYNADWVKRGRGGEVVVSAAQKSKMTQLVGAAVAAASAYQNAIQEEAASKVQFDANTAIWDAELAEARRLVAEAEKIIGG
jgi:hypothetical protein